MVCNRKIVVDRLRNTHESLRFVMSSRIVGKHLYGIHRIVSACIEQAFDIMFLHDLKNFLIYIFMSFDLGHFKTA